MQSQVFKALGVQVILILVATIIGIIVAGKLVEESLLKTALKKETRYFWQAYEQSSDHPIPNTLNLQGFLVDVREESAPPEFDGLALGFHRFEQANYTRLVYVSEKTHLKLILILDEDQVLQLSFYFGLLPLAIALFIIYGVFWFFRFTLKKQMSPIVQLAKQVRDMEIDENFIAKIHPPHYLALAREEIYILHDTLLDLNVRLKAFIERERQFTRDASHELRTPLSVIKGSCEFLSSFASFEGKNLQVLRRIDLSCQKMEALIELLLQLSRVEEFDYHSSQTHINPLIQTLIADQLASMSAEKRAKIELRLDEKMPLWVDISDQFITIIVSNLISNAVKYTQNGYVLVTIQSNGISVKDTGIGMAREGLTQIFAPFYRSDEARNLTSDAADTGFGLGLSIVKRLCDKLNLKVSVESQLGKGSQFSLVFESSTLLNFERTLKS